MGWYDFFSLFYDKALEDRYTPFRAQAFTSDTLGTDTGRTVLDLACGTGQNLPYLINVCGADSQILGVDLSQGMLKRARKRVARENWEGITCLHKDVHEVRSEDLQEVLGVSQVDTIVCALGFTAFPAWEKAFAQSFEWLKEGGRYVIFDVHAEERNMATRQVEIVARADLQRRVWEPLEASASDFSMKYLDNSAKEFGGRLFVASGSKPLTT